jgi:hypothetical protein
VSERGTRETAKYQAAVNPIRGPIMFKQISLTLALAVVSMPADPLFAQSASDDALSRKVDVLVASELKKIKSCRALH